MSQYIALLRGINVGGKHRVAMSVLKQCFEKAGYRDVATYINSGNVLFVSKEEKEENLAKKIEKQLESAFGFRIPVVVRSGRSFEKIAAAIPKQWQNDTEQKSDILFLWKEYDSRKSLSLIRIAKGVDTVRYVPGAILWNVSREQYGKSGMRDFIGTALYKNMTARNVNTVRKLTDLMRKSAGELKEG